MVESQPSWSAYTGQTQADYLGWDWKTALHPDDQEPTEQRWRQAIQHRSLYEHECQIRDRNGTYRDFSIRAVPVINADGTIREWVGTCTDITDRKRADLEIRQLNEQLEQRVQQRTAELTAANQELESFSYSVSHDLRAPLRGIDGFSQVLLDHYAAQLDDKGQHYLNRIRAGTQRMGELIDALLQLSRVTRSDMRRVPVNLSAIAQEIQQELQHSDPDRQVTWQIAPNLIQEGDPYLLRVALDNLLGNAWKFTATVAEPHIEFGKVTDQDDPANFIYYVRDNGAGFDPAYADKLFQAFQRLHAASAFPGTGIGLATVQRIIRRHRGNIWAEGAIGQGAVFYFTLVE
jgi:PAS domain S-box-containing protein